jgi:hypothetical protein
MRGEHVASLRFVKSFEQDRGGSAMGNARQKKAHPSREALREGWALCFADCRPNLAVALKLTSGSVAADA